jgi:hypothetical protein
MAKHKQLANATGVTWHPQGDSRFIPVFHWKSIQFKGEPRAYPAFYKGERLAVLQYLASRIGDFMFGAAPQIWSDDADGRTVITDNPEWDALPFLTTDPETDMPVMSDGSELPTE